MKIILSSVVCILMLITASMPICAEMKKQTVEQLTSRSHTVIQGTVTQIQSEIALDERAYLITKISIAVSEIAKGNLHDETITVTLPGGTLNGIGVWVEHVPEFRVPEEVILFIGDDHKGRYTVVGWSQGKLSLVDGKTTIENNTITANVFMSAIRNFVAGGEQGEILLNANLEGENIDTQPQATVGAVPSITNVYPAVSQTALPSIYATRPYAVNPNNPFDSGDRGCEIVIQGSGFGATQGTSTVRFFERTGITANSENILSWSNTQIRCIVPGGQFVPGKFPHASSGSVYIVTSSGQSNNYQLNTAFAAPNKRFLSLPISYFINQNGTADTDGEFSAIQTSFQTWENVDNSNLTYNYAGTTNRMPNGNDGFNDCGWVESNWQSDPSVIAYIQYIFFTDANSRAIIEFDMFFNGIEYEWTTTGHSDRMDVQNIATHEVGHTLNLLDLYGDADEEKTMYGFNSEGVTKRRTLEEDDIAGARYVYPEIYSFSLQNSFEFDGSSNGQLTIKNVIQNTNSVNYSSPINRNIPYGTMFDISVPSQQIINNRDYRLTSWSDNRPLGVPRTTIETRMTTVTNNFTLSAKYKGHLLSSVQTATSTGGGQRRLVYDAARNAHLLVYESAGQIWLTVSMATVAGGAWSDELLVGEGKHPSLEARDGRIFIVYNAYDAVAPNNRIIRIKQYLYNAFNSVVPPYQPLLSVTEEAFPQLSSALSTTQPYSVLEDAHPVIRIPETSVLTPPSSVAIAFEGSVSGGTQSGVMVVFGGRTFSGSFVWFNIRPLTESLVSAGNFYAYPAIDESPSSKYAIAWQANNAINFALLSEGSGGFTVSPNSLRTLTTGYGIVQQQYPTLTVNQTTGVKHIAWQAASTASNPYGNVICYQTLQADNTLGQLTVIGQSPSTYTHPSIRLNPSTGQAAIDFETQALSGGGGTSGNPPMYSQGSIVEVSNLTGGSWSAASLQRIGTAPNTVYRNASVKVAYIDNLTAQLPNPAPYRLNFYLPSSGGTVEARTSLSGKGAGSAAGDGKYGTAESQTDNSLSETLPIRTMATVSVTDTTLPHFFNLSLTRVESGQAHVGAAPLPDTLSLNTEAISTLLKSNAFTVTDSTTLVSATAVVKAATVAAFGNAVKVRLQLCDAVSGAVLASSPQTSIAGTDTLRDITATFNTRQLNALNRNLIVRVKVQGISVNPNHKLSAVNTVLIDDATSEVQRIASVNNVSAASSVAVPTAFELSQNYPNPFNPTTAIRYALPEVSKVSLKIYDMLGRVVSELVNETKPAGYYEARFDASRLSSGTYFYRLSAISSGSQAGEFVQTKKMTLVK